MMILFLDYDGVLHPDAVYLEKRRPVLRAEGKLFMWAPLLSKALEEHPHVQIVLSTSWARERGFDRARSELPVELRSRVIGATWHSGMAPPSYRSWSSTWWDDATRYEQIHRYVIRAGLVDWLAIDDHPEGWSDEHLDKLIKTDSNFGLSDESVLKKLETALARTSTNIGSL